jgi:hypothetical protein
MGKSGHMRRTQKAAESTADNPMNTTPGMELLEKPTAGHTDPRTGHPRGDGEMRSSPSAWRPMAPRGGPRRSAGKAPGALTILWRGGRSMRREGSRLPRGGGNGRPAGGAGPWRDSWSRDGPQSAGAGPPRRGEPSPATAGAPGPPSAGESAPWTEGTGRTEPATTERGKRPV